MFEFARVLRISTNRIPSEAGRGGISGAVAEMTGWMITAWDAVQSPDALLIPLPQRRNPWQLFPQLLKSSSKLSSPTNEAISFSKRGR